MASPRRALLTPELLELMLLRLDLQTLLISPQLICRAWSALIRESSAIQRMLFFEPAQDSEKRRNSLLIDAFPSFFNEGTTLTLSELGMIKHPAKTAAYTHKEASWRRMLVQQPPVVEFPFLRSHQTRRAGGLMQPANGRALQPGQDLRMQTLFEWLLWTPHVSFKSIGANRIFWGAAPPALVPMRDPRLTLALERVNIHFDLIIVSRYSVGRMRKNEMTDDAVARAQIHAMYESSVIPCEMIDATEGLLVDSSDRFGS
ncbi:hypothetical protein N7492_006344 [Penicillium capsulatum]|uniref:F-box domain-containing protein n=1 Tax=Penicillium capsulatum TaxID=69766 RepID=A0A9W9I3P9_9EURO|nr:hypothetical protein N7492_006344 [Penicillium capsulatum]KAJ6108993.1 hypothetical protein N7512_008830 [Penicillium capsulatum]